MGGLPGDSARVAGAALLFWGLLWAAAAHADRVVTGPALTGVYQSVGGDGVVEFNNFGKGQRVAVEPPPLPATNELLLVQQRQQDIHETGQALGDERLKRNLLRSQELAARRREARERQSAQAQFDASVVQNRAYFGPYRPRFRERGYRDVYGRDFVGHRPRKRPQPDHQQHHPGNFAGYFPRGRAAPWRRDEERPVRWHGLVPSPDSGARAAIAR